MLDSQDMTDRSRRVEYDNTRSEGASKEDGWFFLPAGQAGS
jgi:hypothetical protein